jgi:hypothetical protein
MFIYSVSIFAQNTGELKLVDASGGEVLTYNITDDKIYVSVLDNDYPSEVMVRIGSPVDTLEITLDRESAGVYIGDLSIAESSEGNNSDQVLQAPRGSELEASYIDASDSFGNQKEIKDTAYFGVTLVSGTYSSDKTWRKSESPYLVTGDVEVNNGAKLTIEPGVEVRFTAPSELASGDDQSSGQDPNRSELRLNNNSKLEAKGTLDEPIVLKSNRSNAMAGDWWGIYSTGRSSKVTIRHVHLSDSRYGLYMRDVGGSVLDTISIDNSRIRNIQDRSIRIHDGISTHIRMSGNEFDRGVELGWMYDWSETPLSIEIRGNNFLNAELSISTEQNDDQDDFEVEIKENNNISRVYVYGASQLISQGNKISSSYNVHWLDQIYSRRDSLVSQNAEWTGWYAERVKQAKISHTYVTGYDQGIYLENSEVVIDSSVITGNSANGITVVTNFDNLSRVDTVRYSTITGNGSDGIVVNDYGRLVANYNNIYDNNGYEYRNNSTKWEEVDARYNWWGENTTTEMNEGGNPKNLDEIYDVYDDNGLGLVNYSGWLDVSDGTPSVSSGSAGELKLVDASGGEVLTYNITDDKIYVSVLDNDDPSEVMVRIGSPVDTLEITLDRESAGVYIGDLSIAESSEGNNSDQVLQAPRGSELEASYIDASDSFGNQKEIKDTAYFGVTLVSGTYSSDKTWRKSESPYLVTGDVEVNNGAKLTIEPGVEVRFTAPSELASGDDQSSGQDPNRSELRLNNNSKLEAKGTLDEPIVLKSNRSNAMAGDWWGIYSTGRSSKVTIRHVHLSDSRYGLYMRDVGGSVLDTISIDNSRIRNIQDRSIRIHDGISTHIRMSGNEFDRGVELGWMYDWSETPLSIEIRGNNFLNAELSISTEQNDDQDDFEVEIKENNNISRVYVYGASQLISQGNKISSSYNVHWLDQIYSRRDSLVSQNAEWTGWYAERVKQAKISHTYVTGYDQGIYLENSEVVIDSSVITGNSANGITVVTNFDNLSRVDTVRYSTITGNGSDGIVVNDYGRLVANYNNIYDNNGYEYRNNSTKWEEVDARYNWWGKNTTTEMNEGGNPKNLDEIYDVYDDNGLGLVNYSGWLDVSDGTPSVSSGSSGELKLVDASGGEVLTYNITDDKIYVSVLDNDDPSEVMVRIGSPVDTLEITLDRESAGVYIGDLSIAESSEGNNSDQVLQAPRGSELEASYIDASDSFGNQKEIKDTAYFGVTLVSGTYSSDKTWRKSESPYLVTGDVEVNNGAKLTIEPGVEVRFTAPSELASGDDQSSGQDPNRSELRLNNNSKLEAKGTLDEPIVLKSNRSNAMAGDWWGIYSTGRSSKVTIRHVHLSDSRYGLYMRDVGGSVLDTISIDNSRIRNIQDRSIRIHDGISTHIRMSGNEFDRGVELGWMYDWSETPLSIEIRGNNFLNAELSISTEQNDDQDDLRLR